VLRDHRPSPEHFEARTGQKTGNSVAGHGFLSDLRTEASSSVPDTTRLSYDGAKGQGLDEGDRPGREKVERMVRFDLQMRHFLKVVRRREDEEERCRGEEVGLQALVVCDVVKRSLDTERMMHLVALKVI